MYSFKKEISVKKHMLTKHDHHDFKECQKKPTYIHAVTETYGREHHTEGQDKTLEEELLVKIHKES